MEEKFSYQMERHRIESERRKKMHELIDEYDETVYYPAKKALSERCLEEFGNHDQTKWFDNGLGWSWWICGRCGSSHGQSKIAPSFEDNCDDT